MVASGAQQPLQCSTEGFIIIHDMDGALITHCLAPARRNLALAADGTDCLAPLQQNGYLDHPRQHSMIAARMAVDVVTERNYLGWPGRRETGAMTIAPVQQSRTVAGA
jgi:hypothetical protein